MCKIRPRGVLIGQIVLEKLKGQLWVQQVVKSLPNEEIKVSQESLTSHILPETLGQIFVRIVEEVLNEFTLEFKTL